METLCQSGIWSWDKHSCELFGHQLKQKRRRTSSRISFLRHRKHQDWLGIARSLESSSSRNEKKLRPECWLLHHKPLALCAVMEGHCSARRFRTNVTMQDRSWRSAEGSPRVLATWLRDDAQQLSPTDKRREHQTAKPAMDRHCRCRR